MITDKPLIVFAITLLIALIVSLIPLEGWINYASPDWVALVMLWWVLQDEAEVGVFLAWISGLMLDVSYGNLLGQHALALAVTSYLAIRLQRQYRVYSIIQQTLLVVMFVTLYRIILFWTSGAAGTPPDVFKYWLPILSNLMVWPWLSLILNQLKPATGEDSSSE